LGQAPENGMTTGTSDSRTRGIRAFLPWLIEMGADEIILDRPVNRFAAEEYKTPQARQIEPQLTAPARPALLRAGDTPSGDLVSAAEALASQASTLSGLVEAWHAFDIHPLKRTATRLCFLSGALEARVLVLCDKPRSEEDPTGEVLSGKHQALAERMLAAIGLCGFSGQDTLEQVSLANFVPWRPPGNRSVIDLEARAAVPFTRRLLGLLMPRAVLCLGALPGQYLVGGEAAITRARGRWQAIEIEGRSLPMMTTFHPETLLKSPQSKKLAWQDLQAFRDRLNEA
jgi:uracil-DNA glycosylase